MASAAHLGKLKVDLVLDRAAFQRGIDQARSGVQKFSDTVNKRLSSIGNVPGMSGLQDVLASASKGIGAAVATGVAVASAALAGLSVSAINTAAEIKNLSAVANATPTEFQGWAAGARTVGIEQEKLADILKDMNDRVGDFIATGGGPMADFFERIAPKVGVTADQFRKLSGPEALQLYVDSLEKANVNQQDFTFFMEAIAGDSTALIPLLKNGGKAMREYAARAEALGAVMSDDTVRALAGMKLALGEVGTVLGGLRNQLGGAFAPVLESVAKTFVSLMTKGSALRMVFDGLAEVVRIVATAFSAVVTIVSAVTAGVWELVKSAAAAIEQATGIGEAFRWIIANSPLALIYDLVTGFAKLIRAQGGLGGAIKAVGQLATAVWTAMVASANAIPPGLEAVWASVKAGFFGMIASLSTGWADFIGKTFAGLSDTMPGTYGIVGSDGGDAIKALQESGMAAQAAAKAAAANDEAQIKSANAAAIVSAAWAPVGDLWQSLTATTEDAASALGDDGSSSGGGLAGAADKAGKAGKAAAEKITPLQKVMQRLREENEKLRATFGLSDTEVAIWENIREAQVSATSATGRQIAEMTRQNKVLETANERAKDWRDTMKDTFKSVASGAMSIKDALTNIITKLLEMKAAAMWDSAFSSFGGGGGFSLSGLGNLIRGRGDVLAGALRGAGLPAVPAFATGVKNFRGGMARINERGGEIVSLPSGADVLPHDLSKRLVDRARAEPQVVDVRVGIDPRNGNVTQYVDQRSRIWDGVSARAQQKVMPNIIADQQRRRMP